MSRFKRTAPITLPVLSFKERTVAYVRFESSIHQSDPIPGTESDKQPAWVATVTDLESGEMLTLICPTVLVSVLERDVGDYTGHCFEINVSAEPREGKKYKDVSVWAIECPDTSTPE